METYVYTKLCTLNSYSSSSHNRQKLETSKCPLRSKCSHCGVCVQRALLSAGRDQPWKHTTTWVDLKGIMLNTGSKSWQFPPIWFSSCSKVKKAASGRDSRPMVPGERDPAGADYEGRVPGMWGEEVFWILVRAVGPLIYPWVKFNRTWKKKKKTMSNCQTIKKNRAEKMHSLKVRRHYSELQGNSAEGLGESRADEI